MTFPTALENLNIVSQSTLPPPTQLHDDIAPSALGMQTVSQARRALGQILSGQDPRLFVVVGPCSIHDPAAAMAYARKLKALADELAGQMLIIMRVYFEKPRTTVGWLSLIHI